MVKGFMPWGAKPYAWHPPFTPGSLQMAKRAQPKRYMTGPELQKLLDQARMSQRGRAKRLEIDERTMCRYVAGDDPIKRVVEYAVRYLAEHQQSDKD